VLSGSWVGSWLGDTILEGQAQWRIETSLCVTPGCLRVPQGASVWTVGQRTESRSENLLYGKPALKSAAVSVSVSHTAASACECPTSLIIPEL
jgi:hypothetical protein